ncbi:MAG: hypothetical protein ACKVVP_01395 [Chloroflexota bacterium]
MDSRPFAMAAPVVALLGLLGLLLGLAPVAPIVIVLSAVVGALAELSGRFMLGWDDVKSRLGWTLWILPAAATLAAALAVVQLDPRLARVVPVVGAIVVGAVIVLQRIEVENRPTGSGYRVVFHILAYLTAFVLFTLIYQTKERGLITGTGIAAASGLLAMALLREVSNERRRTLLFACLIGLVAGEITWAANYWVVLALVGGALLLLVFYLLIGISQAILARSLDRRVLVEYMLFGLIGFAIIFSTGPWRT